MPTDAQIEAAAWVWANQFPDPNRKWGDVIAIARAALEAAEALAWQPIDEAPRDGRPLLLHPTFMGMFDVAVGYWHHEHNCWYMGNVGHLSGLWHPTHYRNLPEPPK